VAATSGSPIDSKLDSIKPEVCFYAGPSSDVTLAQIDSKTYAAAGAQDKQRTPNIRDSYF